MTSFVSEAKRSARSAPESTRRVADAVGRLLGSGPGDSTSEDCALLSSSLASATRFTLAVRFDGAQLTEALSELLDCVRAMASSRVDADCAPDLSRDLAASPSALVLEDDCPRCGLDRCALSTPCPACGYCMTGDFGEARIAREARHAARARLDWIVGPTLHLVSLSTARDEILARAGTGAELPADSHHLDAIDAQLEIALRGPSSGRFREVMLALSCVADLERSWPSDSRGGE